MSDQLLEVSQREVPEVPEGRRGHAGVEEAERIQEEGTSEELRANSDEV